ncbi:hypothetical protein BsWGS_04892 [Bradybaena similaris]
MASKTKRLSERSSQSSSTHGRLENREMEYFWSVVLSSEKRSVTWTISENAEEDDDADDLDLVHMLFLRSAVLGGNAVAGEQNIVVLQSTGEDGKSQKGAIAHLTRGQNPMTPLDITIPGKIGATFILSEGSGPVTIAGNHLVEFKEDDLMDDTQMDELSADENEDELGGSGDESDDIKDKKGAKRKATPKTTKQKQKAKMDVEDDQSGEDEDEDEEEEDSDYEVK